MRARDSMSTDFRVVDAAWSPALAHARIERMTSAHVLVRRRDNEVVYYYVFTHGDILARLEKSTAPDLREALDLHEDRADKKTAPNATVATNEPLVVLAGETPVGVIVPRPRVSTGSFRGGVTRSTRGVPANGGGGGGGAAGGSGLTNEAAVRKSPASGPDEPLTRHLTARLPATVATGKTFMLTVDLTAKAEQGSAVMPFAKPAGTKVVILIQPNEGLSVVGDSDREIEVMDPQPEEPLIFQLRAGAIGTGSVRVLAICDGMTVATVTLTTSIVAAGEAQAVVDTVETVGIDAGARRHPDLTLCIYERGSQLDFELWSADGTYHRKKFASVDLKVNPQEYFRSQYQDIENLRTETAQQRKDAARRLALKGADLFENVIPQDLKVLLWDKREEITSVQISSDEPWIPWEFCRLTGMVGGQPEEGKFFGEAFWMTRWLTGIGPPRTISLDNVALVVPGDSGLSHAAEERKYVMSLAKGGRKVTALEPTFGVVTETMERGDHDAWHFTGHAHADQGNDANRAAIELSNQDELRPEDIAGKVQRVLNSRPFIFLNACQSGRAGLSLTGHGGWAKRFIQPAAGILTASAFIGSYWMVDDEAAFDFAKALYDGLLVQGKAIGEAARDARLAIRKHEDPTWLAYTVYADPFATVK